MKNEKYITLLASLVEIPSISSIEDHREDVVKSANTVKKLFQDLGLETKISSVASGKPAVLAKTEIDPKKKTVLLYAHHDVQPVGDEGAWQTDPFTPEIINGRMYGRGSGDDKAGVVLHYAVTEELLGDLPVNIKLFIEGEEEIGSPTMEEFVRENREDLDADVIVIADSGNIRIGEPTITTSLRGLVDATINVKLPIFPVHSGVGGGIVPDAMMVLSKILSSFHDSEGNLLIEGLVVDKSEVTEMDKELLDKMLGGDKNIPYFKSPSMSEKLWLEPALDILAINAPRVEESVNLIIPEASAKVSLRLAPSQDPDEAMDLLCKHVKENSPWGVDVNFIPGAKGSGVLCSSEGEFIQTLLKEFSNSWGKEPSFMGVGGSIPFANVFSEKFPNAEIALIGVSDGELGNAHAPNESVELEDLEKMIEALSRALIEYGK